MKTPMWPFYVLLCLGFSTFLTIYPNQMAFGQTWQQNCDYEIEVTLDDTQHLLDGSIKINYSNHSPDTLDFLYFHLWPNAYKNQKTAFAQQQLENGSTRFYHALPSQKGYIHQLDFKVNGQSTEYELDKEHIDICKLLLNKPLKPGESIEIESPFQIKIPYTFSRFGHNEQSYQITQWYPKPAVYDQNGWHPMPYLDQGEFYSEYGSFDVKITLPENYVVAATGDLQTASEIEFLNKKVEATAKIDSFNRRDLEHPESASNYKTLHYKQDQIHDFAWFADKRFHVKKEIFDLVGTDRKVTAWAMFTNYESQLWKKSTDYIRDAVNFYSEKVGTYPYNQATAIQSTISAGAGMEYPNITIIGPSGTDYLLETVIVHEVGHNWFYGQLGSNERDFPWMDEGLNSYYEQRYFRDKYPNPAMLKELSIPNFLYKLTGLDPDMSTTDLYQMAYKVTARKHNDQPIGCHSEELTSSNYGNMVYLKSVLAMNYLESFLGQAELDRIMQSYYQQYEFKHPQPADLKAVFEEESGRMLDWFFDELIPTTKPVDYWLHKLLKNAEQIGDDSFDAILVRNHPRNVQGPYSITAVKAGKPIYTVRYDGFHGQEEVLFPSMDYDELILDYYKKTPELNRRNNLIKPRGLLKHSRGLKISMLPRFEEDYKGQLFITPILGANVFNKLMLGAAFYNNIQPDRKFQYTIAPMYALGTNTITGTADLNYTVFPSFSFIKKMRFGLDVKSFAYTDGARNIVENERFTLSYLRYVPRLEIEFQEKSARSMTKKTLTLRSINITGERVDTMVASTPNLYISSRQINEVAFNLQNKKTLNPYGFKLTFQQSPDFMFGSFEGNYRLNFGKDNRALDLRFFAGSFFNYTFNEEYPFRMNLTGQGEFDYAFDYPYFARTDTDHFLYHQIYPIHGHFKIIRSNRSTEWMTALNVESQLPFIKWKLPIRIFADFGFAQFTSAEEPNFLYDAGVSINLFQGKANVYFPLFFSEEFDSGTDQGLLNRMTFMIRLDQMDPVKVLRKLTF